MEEQFNISSDSESLATSVQMFEKMRPGKFVSYRLQDLTS